MRLTYGICMAFCYSLFTVRTATKELHLRVQHITMNSSCGGSCTFLCLSLPVFCQQHITKEITDWCLKLKSWYGTLENLHLIWWTFRDRPEHYPVSTFRVRLLLKTVAHFKLHYWRCRPSGCTVVSGVVIVVVASSAAAATVTALKWEPVNVRV